MNKSRRQPLSSIHLLGNKLTLAIDIKWGGKAAYRDYRPTLNSFISHIKKATSNNEGKTLFKNS